MTHKNLAVRLPDYGKGTIPIDQLN